MNRKLLNGKHIKIYNKKHTSYKELRDKDFFAFLEKLTDTESKIIYTVLIETIRLISTRDKLPEKYIKKSLETLLRISETSFKISLNPTLKKELISLFLKEYNSRFYINYFRGDLVEYITMQLTKGNNVKSYHEPTFRYKKKPLVPKHIKGCDCLIDIVCVKKQINILSLYECKADIDNFIGPYKKKSKAFTHKLNYMDYLEMKIAKYTYNQKNSIGVSKHFVSLNSPSRDLPEKYKRYEILDILTLLRLGKATI